MHSHCELNLDEDGNLIDLRKKHTKQLLSPKQVADSVKVQRLRGGEGNDRLPKATAEPFQGEITGKNVNVIGGATGTGKTSLIHILAGGMETEPKLSSDTKCPTIYILEVNGSEVAILDTAGLCDTDADTNKEPEMQELLINAVAATIKRFELKVVNFLMCIDVDGRLPGKFSEVWPQMQVSLGGEKLGSFCRFVMTKVNADNVRGKAKLDQLPKSEAYQKLKFSSLGWPVMTAGHENLDEIKGLLKATSEASQGLGAKDLRTDVEGLEMKRKKADKVQKQIGDLEKKMQMQKVKSDEMFRMLKEVEGSMDDAYEELASLGYCSSEKKSELRDRISKFKSRKTKLERQHMEGCLNEEQLRKEVQKWQKDLAKELEEIREMEKLGNPFQHLSRAAGRILSKTFGGS